MTAEPLELRNVGYADRACAHCGWRFFTTLGLAEHVRDCAHRQNLRERGLAVVALVNSRRVECAECGHISTPGGLSLHQKYRGHEGRIER